MREYESDRDLLTKMRADKLALCDVGKSPELVQCVEGLPEDIPKQRSESWFDREEFV